MPTSDELKKELEDENLEPRKRHLLQYELRLQEDAEAAGEAVDQEPEHERQIVERAGATEIEVDQDPEPLKVEIGDDEAVEDKTPAQQASHDKGLPDEEEIPEEEQEAVEAEVEADPGVSPVAAAVQAEDEVEGDPDEASKKLDKK